MKRILALLLLTVTLSVPINVSATHSGGRGSDYDKVDGTVEDLYPSTLHINAISGPNGEAARGHFYVRADAVAWDEVGDVTCLNVVGNRAYVGGRIDRSKLPGLPGEGNGMLFLVVDNGEPGDTDAWLGFFFATPPITCPTPSPFAFPHDRGNFVVHDASP